MSMIAFWDDLVIFYLMRVFVKFRHDLGVQADLGGVGRRLERKGVRVDDRIGLPVLDPQRVLRRAGQRQKAKCGLSRTSTILRTDT